jgi:RNA polymerase sigma-70 factor (ECF subfamily)
MRDFAAMVEAESRGLVAAVTAIVGDSHRAEEIVQDAFERCFQRWRRVSTLDRPGAWVRRVAINEAISTTRRRASERRALERAHARLDRLPHAPDAAADLGDAGIWAAVRALPSDQATAIALRYGADLPLEDIAETMSTTVPAVKSLLHRGRAALRDSATLRTHAT